MRNPDNTTTYRENLKNKILDTSMLLFKEKGIRAVKMDDIAKEMGISKRTLYEIYGKKEDLLMECLRHHSDKTIQKITEYAKKEKNQMKIITFALSLKLEDLTSTSHQYMNDIKKYPKIVELMQQGRNLIAEKSGDFVQSCIDQGYFRSDVNYKIVNRISDAVMDYMMNNKIYQEYSWAEIFSTFIRIHLNGFCTEKGQKYLKSIVDELS